MMGFPEHTLLPLPDDVTLGDDCLEIDGEFRIALTGAEDPRLALAAERFAQDIRQLTCSRVSTALGEIEEARLVVDLGEASDAPADSPDDESYALTVSAGGARLEAPRIHGAMHGLQTLLQLVMPSTDGYQVLGARIVDRPRFAWRGLLIDAVRHWMPPAVIKRNLNAMAAVKLNVFHWHLTDDQGFRIESRRLPRLHECGSDGKYYTQEEVRDIVEHAWNRGIRVVPEFDMPGHATSWLVGHPELASATGPYTLSRRYGGHKATMDPTTARTFECVRTFLLEMIPLFPSGFIHLGGDQVDPEHWQANAAIRDYMEEERLDGPHELLVDFHNDLLDMLHDQGCEAVGWDPLISSRLDPRAIVQSVRGQEWVARAIRSGHRTIASSEYYLDAMLPASHHYLIDPFDGEVAEATDEERALILGAEASMWTEFATAENVDSRIWPRAAAVAERLWSPREVRDVEDMYRRLSAVSHRLDAAGSMHNVGPRRMQNDLAGDSSRAAVRVLADVVEPITLETRWKLLSRYTTNTPLNRLVDAAVPDGEEPRAFIAMAAAFVADPSHDATYRRLEADLRLWKQNHERLAGADADPLLAEVGPISKALADVADVGLTCVGALHASKPMAPGERKAHTAILDSASLPIAEVTIAVIPGIRMLLEAVPDEVAIA